MSDQSNVEIVEHGEGDTALARPTSDVSKVQSAIMQAREQGCTVLAPETYLESDEEFEYSIRFFKFDDTPNQYDNKDFYKPGGGGWAMHKNALQKIASAFGIQWLEPERIDNFQHPNLAVVRAKAIAPDPATGQMRSYSATKQLDLRDESAEVHSMRARYRKNGQWKTYKKGPNGKERYKRDLRQKRTHINELAETGAKNRIIREVTGVRQDYTDEEIRSPFAVVSVVSRPGEHEQIEQAQEANEAVGQLYGSDGVEDVDDDSGDGSKFDEQPPPAPPTGDDVQDESGPSRVSFGEEGWQDCVEDWEKPTEFPTPDEFSVLVDEDREASLDVLARCIEVSEFSYEDTMNHAGHDPKTPLRELPDNWLTSFFEQALDKIDEIPF
ncbi:MAG: hypothetical protein ABEN55_00375 [Bradymonadaceae bacterium]